MSEFTNNKKNIIKVGEANSYARNYEIESKII